MLNATCKSQRAKIKCFLWTTLLLLSTATTAGSDSAKSGHRRDISGQRKTHIQFSDMLECVELNVVEVGRGERKQARGFTQWQRGRFALKHKSYGRIINRATLRCSPSVVSNSIQSVPTPLHIIKFQSSIRHHSNQSFKKHPSDWRREGDVWK